MRLPIRRGEKMKKRDEETLYVTPAGITAMEREIQRIEHTDLPEAIADVRQTAAFGDFSENAEYQEAKSRMRRLHARLFQLKEQVKQAVVIRKTGADRVSLGSTILVDINGA